MRTVLILESGSDSGFDAAQTVNAMGYRAVPLDTDPFAMSANLPRFELIKAGNEMFFVEDLKCLIEDHGASYLLPTFHNGAREVMHRYEKEGWDARPLLSPTRTLGMMQDKLAYGMMGENVGTGGVALTRGWWTPETPFAKTRLGKGSVGTGLCLSDDHAAKMEAEYGMMVFQEHLPGPQFTVDVLTHPDTGVGLQAAVRHVHRMRGGSDVVVDVLPGHELEKQALELAEGLGVRGICNFEYRQGEDGRFKAIDLNPRVSASHMASAVAGFPIVPALLDLAEGDAFRPYPLKAVRVYRHRATHATPLALETVC